MEVVEEIRRRGMVAAAVFFLELHKPLATVGGFLLEASAPLLVPFVGTARLQEFIRILQSREEIERLIQQLEAPPPKADDGI